MRKILFSSLTIASLAIGGCAAPKVSVYGKSGLAYTAPSLCAALVQCMNSSENACYYDRSLYQTANGGTEESGCKEVKK